MCLIPRQASDVPAGRPGHLLGKWELASGMKGRKGLTSGAFSGDALEAWLDWNSDSAKSLQLRSVTASLGLQSERNGTLKWITKEKETREILWAGLRRSDKDEEAPEYSDMERVIWFKCGNLCVSRMTTYLWSVVY